jgi:hypothetical protein
VILSGPSPAVIAAPPPTQAQITVFNLIVNFADKSFTINYGAPAGLGRQVQGVLPAGIATALSNHAKAAIETDQGWLANSATVVQP